MLQFWHCSAYSPIIRRLSRKEPLISSSTRPSILDEALENANEDVIAAQEPPETVPLDRDALSILASQAAHKLDDEEDSAPALSETICSQANDFSYQVETASTFQAFQEQVGHISEAPAGESRPKSACESDTSQESDASFSPDSPDKNERSRASPSVASSGALDHCPSQRLRLLHGKVKLLPTFTSTSTSRYVHFFGQAKLALQLFLKEAQFSFSSAPRIQASQPRLGKTSITIETSEFTGGSNRYAGCRLTGRFNRPHSMHPSKLPLLLWRSKAAIPR